MVHTLHKEQWMPISVQEAWAFFSTANNLAKITPPEMGFVILSKLDGGPIYSGMLIDYIVKPLLGIPLRWTTEITGVSAPNVFTDKQLKGPYALWEHTHTFEQVKGGVKMTDEVKYALPLGVLGELAHSILVKKKLNDIFDFRERTLTKLFGEYK